MRPITQTVPKPWLPVGTLPLIGYAAKLLAYHGITQVAVNLHHLAQPLQQALGDGSDFGVQFTFSHEAEILGTGGALRRIHHFVDETLVVVNSDTVVDLDLYAVVAQHKARGALATMVLRDDPAKSSYGLIGIDAVTGRIRQILGQDSGSCDTLLTGMFVGVHVLEPLFLHYVLPGVYSDIVRGAYMQALTSGAQLYGTWMRQGCWADAGTPARYRKVNAEALAGALRLRHADPRSWAPHAARAAMPEGVCVAADAVMGKNVQFSGPALVGPGARLGDGVVVGPGSIVGPGADIGAGARLHNSVVLAGAHVAPGKHVCTMLIGQQNACLSLADGESAC